MKFNKVTQTLSQVYQIIIKITQETHKPNKVT